MPRSSDIDRIGAGSRVLELAAAGSTHSAIATIVKNEAGHTISAASVGRYLSKHSVNATVVPTERSSTDMLVAAISGLADTRDTDVTSYYGINKINTANIFTEYYGVARGIGNGQVMRAFKAIALKITNGAWIIGDESDSDKISALANSINFLSLLQNVVRYTCEMGTCIVGMKTDGVYTTPLIVPMQYYTLVTDSETIGTVDDNLVHGEITKVVFDEMGDRDNRQVMEREDVGLLRLWEDGTEVVDVAGRSTFGIYGESMTRGIEIPLKSLLNSSYFYDEFIKRYGLGRLHINLKTLAEMIKDKTVNLEQAQIAQDADTAAIQKIGPNEDIVSTGREVSMIESKQGFDIVPYLDWRRKQIDRALLQSDVGAGDVGNAWTSSGTAVSAQDYDSYKSLRETLFEQFLTEIIVPRCEEFAIDPSTLSITATPFLRVNVPFNDLIDAYDRGIITEPELRDRLGCAREKPDEE